MTFVAVPTQHSIWSMHGFTIYVVNAWTQQSIWSMHGFTIYVVNAWTPHSIWLMHGFTIYVVNAWTQRYCDKTYATNVKMRQTS